MNSCDSAAEAAESSAEAPHGDQFITEYFPAGLPLEAHLVDIMRVADEHSISTTVWQFAPMQPGETLQEHVRRQVELHGSTACPGPASEVRCMA